MGDLRAAIAALMAAALGLAACGPRQDRSAADTFSVALAGDPGSLDPHQNATYAPAFVDAFAYVGLVGRGADGAPVPALAESWTATPLSVTYRLRSDASCADDSPLTAALVAANYAYVADPRNRSPLLGGALPIGARVAFDEARRSVTVTVPEPNSFLVEMTGGLPIVCRRGLADRTRLLHGADGAGPYRLVEAAPNDHYLFERRAGHEGLPRRVLIRIIPNQTTAANLLLSGELTAAAVNGPDRARLQAAGLRPVASRGPGVQMWFNQAPGRLGAEESVRRALAISVKVSALAKVGGGAWGLAPLRLAGAQPSACPSATVPARTPPYDPAAAARLLEAAGWRMGQDGVRLRGGRRLSLAMTWDRDLSEPTAMAAAAELAVASWRAVGIEVRARGVSGAGVGEVLFGTGDYDISWTPIVVSLPNRLLAFISGPTPPQGTNFPHAAFPEVGALAARANRTAGPASCEVWDEIERLYLDRAAVVPVVDFDNAILTRRASFRMNGLAIVADSLRLVR